MNIEKKVEPKELTDEQLNDVAGGANFRKISESCFFCRHQCHLEDIGMAKVDGVMRKICTSCLSKLDKNGNEYTTSGKV